MYVQKNCHYYSSFAVSLCIYIEHFLLEYFISTKLNFLVSSMFSCVPAPQNAGFRDHRM